MTQSQNNLPFFKRYDWRLPTLTLIIGIIGGIVIHKFWFAPAPSTVAADNQTICGLRELPKSDELMGIISNEDEYRSVTDRFQAQHPQRTDSTVTWGGTIGKQYLIALVNSLGPRESLMYKFAKDDATGNTCIYFQGGNTDPVSGATVANWFYFRTGSKAESYCPIVCNPR